MSRLEYFPFADVSSPLSTPDVTDDDDVAETEVEAEDRLEEFESNPMFSSALGMLVSV